METLEKLHYLFRDVILIILKFKEGNILDLSGSSQNILIMKLMNLKIPLIGKVLLTIN